MKRLTGYEAIEAAERGETIVLYKYGDPTEDGRTVSTEEAREIAAEDAGLIFGDLTEATDIVPGPA